MTKTGHKNRSNYCDQFRTESGMSKAVSNACRYRLKSTYQNRCLTYSVECMYHNMMLHHVVSMVRCHILNSCSRPTGKLFLSELLYIIT
jgi:hypothetical protein